MRFYSKLLSRRTRRTIIAYGIILLTCASVTTHLLLVIYTDTQRNEITINLNSNKKFDNVTDQLNIKSHNLTDFSYTKQTYDRRAEISEDGSQSATIKLQVLEQSQYAPNGQYFLTDKKQAYEETTDKRNQHQDPHHSNVMQLKGSEQNNMKREDDEQYKVVFFIGGHKCGSTTLAMYLKHDPNNWKLWDPKGQFLHSGKEVCWALHGNTKEQFWDKFSNRDSKTAIFALDACPFAVERSHFERMATVFPNAYYLMLVRDPVDRVISHMNIELNPRFGKPLKENIDDHTRKAIKSESSRPARLSMFGKTLKIAYDILPKHKIMIVPNQDLKRQPQQTVDKVLRHIGAKPKNVTPLEANKMRNRDVYKIPSNTTINWLRNMFNQDWEIFKNLSGLHIDTIYI